MRELNVLLERMVFQLLYWGHLIMHNLSIFIIWMIFSSSSLSYHDLWYMHELMHNFYGVVRDFYDKRSSQEVSGEVLWMRYDSSMFDASVMQIYL